MILGLFILGAMLSALVGFTMLTSATTGVGFIALACLMAIFARLAQAAEHQRELRALAQRGESSKLPL